MDLEALVSGMSQPVYERLKHAVETGKWPNGEALTNQQKASSLQVVMAYQSKVLKTDVHMTVNAEGEITQKSRQQFKRELSQQSAIARFKQDDF